MDDLHLHRLQSRRQRVIARLRRERSRSVCDLALVRRLALRLERLRTEVVRVQRQAAAL